MKKILIIFAFLFSVIATAQQYHDKGAKFEFATNEGDTITVNTRIPIIDEFGLINYYVDVADLLALNPAPVLEWGNITGTLSNQTDLQGALDDKADQSDLTAHTSNGNIHFTQSAISITESQITDFKDYLRGDINDTNGANKLTLGSLEVTGQTILQNGLNMTSVPTGTSNNILTLNQSTGDVEQRVFSLGDIDIANASGVSQFPVGLGDQLRIQGSGDTSISFDGITNTININSTPGSGGGGAVTSFNGRDGAVVSQAGDYSTAMVNENTNLYFTEARVRGTDLTGLTVTNTPISSTNTFIQALGRLQGQINNRDLSFSAGNLSIEGGNSVNLDSRYYSIAQLNTSGFSNVHWNNVTNKPTTISGYGITDAYTKSVSDGRFLHSGVSDTKTNGYTRFIPAVQWGENAEVVTNYISGSNEWRLDFPTNALVRWRNSGFGDTFTLNTSTGATYTSGLATLAGGATISGGNLTLNDFRRFYFGTGNDAYITYDGSGNRLNMILNPSLVDFRILDGSNPIMTINRLENNTTFNQTITGNNGFKAFGSLAPWFDAIVTNNTDSNIFRGRDSNNNTIGSITTRQLNGTGGGYLSLNGEWRINENSFWHSGNFTPSNYVPNTRTITAGDGLTGGGNLTANRTLSVDATVARMNATNTGSLTVTGDVIANSDKRLKKNIKRIDNALAIVQLLGGYEYDRKDIDLHQAGVIAQEVEEVFPTAVSEDEKGIKSVAYNQLIALLIEAVKEQQIEIEQLKTLIYEK